MPFRIQGNTYHADSTDGQADDLEEPTLENVLRRIVFCQLLLETLREI